MKITITTFSYSRVGDTSVLPYSSGQIEMMDKPCQNKHYDTKDFICTSNVKTLFLGTFG